jgi:hypothetical protein
MLHWKLYTKKILQMSISISVTINFDAVKLRKVNGVGLLVDPTPIKSKIVIHSCIPAYFDYYHLFILKVVPSYI